MDAAKRGLRAPRQGSAARVSLSLSTHVVSASRADRASRKPGRARHANFASDDDAQAAAQSTTCSPWTSLVAFRDGLRCGRSRRALGGVSWWEAHDARCVGAGYCVSFDESASRVEASSEIKASSSGFPLNASPSRMEYS